MLRPTAVLVEPVENYQLMVEFDNGEKKKFDVKPYIQGSFYGQLSDPAYFKSVKTNGFSVEWEMDRTFVLMSCIITAFRRQEAE